MTERIELVGWDRTAYLLTCWPMSIGYAINRHGGSADHDTLEGIAVDELFALADRYPEWCEEEQSEPSGKVFWTFLKRNIDHRVWKEWSRKRAASFDDLTHDDDGNEFYWGRMLLSAHDLDALRRPSLLHQAIVDAIAVLPARWKILLALRFHEELPISEVAEIVGAETSATQVLLTRAVAQVREVALHETKATPVTITPVRTKPWDIPFSVHRWVWLNTRHPDVHAWLGHVQHDYALEVGYVTDMLWTARGVGILHGARGITRPEKHAPCGSESAYQRHLRKQEPIDESCEQGHAEYNRMRTAQRRSEDLARARGEIIPDRRRGSRAA